MKFFMKKQGSDKADSSLVSLVIIIPLVFSLIVTTIDVSMYFANRSLVQNVARDGARTIAIVGGNGTASQATTLEAAYGLNRDAVCNDAENVLHEESTVNINDKTAVECNILNSLKSSSLINVFIKDVNCTPEIVTGIGDMTECTVNWGYSSIPGSGMMFVKSTNGGEKNPAFSNPSAFENNFTTGTSESEVNLSGTSLVNR